MSELEECDRCGVQVDRSEARASPLDVVRVSVLCPGCAADRDDTVALSGWSA